MSEPSPLFLTARPGSDAPESAPLKAGGPRPTPAGRPGGPGPAAILGVPLDRTTSYRSGTAAGPTEIRAASWSLETYSPALGADLTAQVVYDFGDVTLDRGRPLEADLEAIERATAELRGRGFTPVIVGGEHLLTLATYRGVVRWAGRGDSSGPPGDPPVFLHFDAHADLRDAYEGLTLSHATVVRRVSELAGPRNVYQFGIRSGEREEMAWGQANVNRVGGNLVEATRQALRLVAGRRVYCSVDIDLFDPAHAPGTGNPEPGGPAAADVFEAVLAVGVAASLGATGGGIDLVAFDLVEVSPPLDPTGRTVVLAAKLLRELLIARHGRAEG